MAKIGVYAIAADEHSIAMRPRIEGAAQQWAGAIDYQAQIVGEGLENAAIRSRDRW
jgi:hypothetical protein